MAEKGVASKRIVEEKRLGEEKEEVVVERRDAPHVGFVEKRVVDEHKDLGIDWRLPENRVDDCRESGSDDSRHKTDEDCREKAARRSALRGRGKEVSD